MSSVAVLQQWCQFIQAGKLQHLCVYFQELLVQKFGKKKLKNCVQIDSEFSITPISWTFTAQA